MTPEEIATLLAESRKVHLATIGRGGMPHLVTMYYVMIDGLITFWTYRASQKAVNLAADPRISCLVESGEQYFDLRGVQVQGVARRIDDHAAVMQIGRLITAGLTGQDPAVLEEYVERAARKRAGYAVEPRRVISWDHSKLVSRG
jgi:PPOX class probable F420-dependent enzyme